MAAKKMLFVALLTLVVVLTGTAFAQNETGPPTVTPALDLVQLMQIVSFITIFVGVLARAFLPYIRKWLADEPIGGFQKRYIFILIVSFGTTWIAWPNLPAAFASWTWWQMLTASFAFGFGLQSTYTEVYAWIEAAAGQGQTQPQTQPPPTT